MYFKCYKPLKLKILLYTYNLIIDKQCRNRVVSTHNSIFYTKFIKIWLEINNKVPNEHFTWIEICTDAKLKEFHPGIWKKTYIF